MEAERGVWMMPNIVIVAAHLHFQIFANPANIFILTFSLPFSIFHSEERPTFRSFVTTSSSERARERERNDAERRWEKKSDEENESQREPSQKFSPRCTKLFLTFIFLSHLFLISLKTNFQSMLKKWNVCIAAAAVAVAAAAVHPPHPCTGEYLCMVKSQKLTQIKWAQKGPIAHDQNEKEKLRLFLFQFCAIRFFFLVRCTSSKQVQI